MIGGDVDRRATDEHQRVLAGQFVHEAENYGARVDARCSARSHNRM